MNTMHRFPRPARHFLGTGVQGFDAVKQCTQEGECTVQRVLSTEIYQWPWKQG